MSNEGQVRSYKYNNSKKTQNSIETSPEKEQSHQNELDVDDTPEKAHEFICRLLEESGKSSKFLVVSSNIFSWFNVLLTILL